MTNTVVDHQLYTDISSTGLLTDLLHRSNHIRVVTGLYFMGSYKVQP